MSTTRTEIARQQPARLIDRLTRRIGSLATLAGAVAVAAAAACADAPSAPRGLAPSAAPRAEVLATPAYATGLKRVVPLPAAVRTPIVVDGAGGKYRLPGGLLMEVQSGTFKEPTALTVTSLAGDMVAYEFEPHGLVFKQPLLLQQELGETDWAGKDLSRFEVGYFANSADLKSSENKALVKEFLKATVDVKSKKLTFDVFHFSGYMVSTGRDGDDAGF